jgi:hypothetical protein
VTPTNADGSQSSGRNGHAPPSASGLSVRAKRDDRSVVQEGPSRHVAHLSQQLRVNDATDDGDFVELSGELNELDGVAGVGGG